MQTHKNVQLTRKTPCKYLNSKFTHQICGVHIHASDSRVIRVICTDGKVMCGISCFLFAGMIPTFLVLQTPIYSFGNLFEPRVLVMRLYVIIFGFVQQDDI